MAGPSRLGGHCWSMCSVSGRATAARPYCPPRPASALRGDDGASVCALMEPTVREGRSDSPTLSQATDPRCRAHKTACTVVQVLPPHGARGNLLSGDLIRSRAGRPDECVDEIEQVVYVEGFGQDFGTHTAQVGLMCPQKIQRGSADNDGEMRQSRFPPNPAEEPEPVLVAPMPAPSPASIPCTRMNGADGRNRWFPGGNRRDPLQVTVSCQ